MTITSNTYTGDGSTVLFTFSWPYLEKDDVYVQIDADIQARPTAWDFVNTNTIEFVTAPASGVRVSIYRRTNVDDLYYTFYPGSTIKAKSLNNDFEQTLFVSQESQNRYLDLESGGEITGDVNFNGDVVFNESVTINKYPTADTDAANKLYVDTQDKAYDDAVRSWATSEFVNASGDQMTGQLDMTNHKIVRLANPQDSSDAVNKQYVDGILIGSGGNISSFPVVRYILTAVGGETVINPEAPIAPGNEIVTVNGSTLTPSDDYTINGTDSITLRQPLLPNDQVMVLSYNSLKVVEVESNFETYPFTRWVDTATAGQTVFQGLGDGTVTLGYSPGYEQVTLNGSRLTRDVDYIANDKLSVILVQGALEGDVLEVLCGNYLKTGDQESYAASDISYTYPGGVPSNVQQRLEQYVSVKDFGAVGDGVTDDTAAIQAALDTGGPIIIPEGVFFISNHVYFKQDGQTLAGFGNSSVIKTQSGNVLIHANNKNNLTIRDFKLDGTGVSAGVTNGGIHITGSNGRILNVYFYKGQQRCWFHTADHWLIEGCTFEGTGYGVIQQNANISSYVTVNNCIARSMLSDFVELNQASPVGGEISRNWTVSNCQYSGNQSYSVAGGTEDRFFGSTTVKNIIITGNQIQNVGGDSAIHCEAVGGETIISNNVFYNNKASGGNSGIIYLLNSSENTVVTGNIFIQDDYDNLGDTPYSALALNSNTYNNSVNFTGNRVVAKNGCVFRGLVLSFQSGCSLNITGNDFEGLQYVLNGASARNVNFTGNSTLDCEYVINHNNNANNKFWVIADNSFVGTTGDWDISVVENNGTNGIEQWKISGNTFGKGVRIRGAGSPGGDGENRGILISDNQLFNGATIDTFRTAEFYITNNQVYDSSNRTGKLISKPSHIDVGQFFTRGFTINQSSKRTGSQAIDINGLLVNSTGNWERSSILVSYSGIAGDASGSFTNIALVSARYNSSNGASSATTNDILGTSNIAVSSTGPDHMRLSITLGQENSAGYYTVMVMGRAVPATSSTDGTTFTYTNI
jgi:hypothetical protein